MKIGLNEKMAEIKKKPWMPVEISRVNNKVIRMVLFKGEYHWHTHKEEDELIRVHHGKIVVQFKDRPNI